MLKKGPKNKISRLERSRKGNVGNLHKSIKLKKTLEINCHSHPSFDFESHLLLLRCCFLLVRRRSPLSLSLWLCFRVFSSSVRVYSESSSVVSWGPFLDSIDGSSLYWCLNLKVSIFFFFKLVIVRTVLELL